MFRNRTSAVYGPRPRPFLAGCQKDAGATAPAPPAPAAPAAVEPKTDDEKILYAMGIVMGRNLDRARPFGGRSRDAQDRADRRSAGQGRRR